MLTGSYGPPPGKQRTIVVDPASSARLGEIGPVIGNQALTSMSPESDVLAVGGYGENGPILATINVRSGSVQWEWSVPSQVGDYKPWVPGAVWVSRDERRAFVYPVSRNDTLGIAAIGIPSGEITHYLPTGLNGRLLRTLAGVRYPPGTIAVLSSPPMTGPAIAFYSEDLELLDAVAVPASVRKAVLTPDESAAYYITDTELGKVDLVNGGVVARTAVTTDYFLALSGNGASVFIQDIAQPHLGLSEYAPSLTFRRSISLDHAIDEGVPTHIEDLVVSPDGTRAFVLTGHSNPFIPLERSVLRTVDLATGQLLSVLELHEVGVSQIHALWR